jgi:hypothetical protein
MVFNFPPREYAAKFEIEGLGGSVSCYSTLDVPCCFVYFAQVDDAEGAPILTESEVFRAVSAASQLFSVVPIFPVRLPADIS